MLLAVLMTYSCGSSVPDYTSSDEDVQIFPDYKGVVIPVNIAPLDFNVQGVSGSRLMLVVEGGDESFSVKGKDGCFEIPSGKWSSLLEKSQGHDIKFTVCQKEGKQWIAYKPFSMTVSPDKIDQWVAYRLIAPGYGLWNKMGIYQRNLESYDQSPIYENKMTDNNCVNCHSFRMQDPSKMVFHMRARHGGTVYVDGKEVTALNTKTPETISALVYPYWHPSGDYIAFSNNATKQAFFSNHANRIEVYDSASDIVVYNVGTHEIVSCPQLKSEGSFETFPSFSPDGKYLYFCTAPACGPMPDEYKEAHYSLCRIGFDAASATFSSQVDTIYNAKSDGASASFPRVSPDGKYLVFTHHGFGNFSIWHKDADLWEANLSDGSIRPLSEANSGDVDSYHSWSHSSRWMVFSSRRGDGLYTRLYITYMDAEGNAHKPFLLPQKNPGKYYGDLMFSYNIPEFITGKVRVNQHDIAVTMDKPQVQVNYAGE